LVLKGGEDLNPIDKPGLASLTADMLEYGTDSRSATKIAEDLEQLGTTLTTFSTTNSSGAKVETLTKTVNGAFEILSDLVLHPVFAEKELERSRKLRITAIDQEKDEPSQISRRIIPTDTRIRAQ
jgi:zinc protease